MPFGQRARSSRGRETVITEPAPTATKANVPAEVVGGAREWRAFARNPMSWVGVGLLCLIVAFSFLGPVIDRTNPYTPNLLATLAPPSRLHPLGTDNLGRDYLVRLMVGGQLSLEVGGAAAGLTMIIGVGYGLVSGYLGGAVDAVLMRILDVLYAIPSLFLILAVDALFQPGATVLVVVIAVFSWFGVARLVRGEILSLKEREFLEAARSFGATDARLMLKHLLPNVIGVVVVSTSLQVANAILTVAGLSFLGLGLPPPTPNWGGMLSDSLNYLFQNAWWLTYPPGLAIVLVELGVNLAGDAVREAFDPRLGR
jgi:peptide/nickel transport system permease protein